MVQTILVGIIFITALIFLGRFIYRQMKVGNDENGHCDKCLPKQASINLKKKN